MSNPRARLAAINALPLPGPVRVLHLSGDQERAISQSRLRRLLPTEIELVAGPGCAATICPTEDIHQAIRLATDQPITLMTDETLLRMPGPTGCAGPRSLAEAQAEGADVRTVSAPVEAVMLARDRPDREVVLFLAGFETLLVPLAGQILEGLPDNLSLLLCGRRIESLLEDAMDSPLADFDALLLPGNQCALMGLDHWERVVGALRRPAVVGGYSASGLLTALEALLQRLVQGGTGLINRFQSVARQQGWPEAEQRLNQVFEPADDLWRGPTVVRAGSYRLRSAYSAHDANDRHPDFRNEVFGDGEYPDGCECRAVSYGVLAPAACGAFGEDCRPSSPLGPCMASVDGTCRIQSTADAPSLRSVAAH